MSFGASEKACCSLYTLVEPKSLVAGMPGQGRKPAGAGKDVYTMQRRASTKNLPAPVLKTYRNAGTPNTRFMKSPTTKVRSMEYRKPPMLVKSFLVFRA